MMKRILMAAAVLVSACTSVLKPDLRLHYDKPAEYFEEALPIGNGRIGAMVYGAATGEERLSLNDITLWSGEPEKGAAHPDMVEFGLTGDGVQTLEAVREALEQEDYRTAERLQRGLQGHYSESYLPLGNLRIQYLDSAEVTEYERSLDISRAVATVSCLKDGKPFKAEYFASAPDSVIVVRIVASGKPAQPSYRERRRPVDDGRICAVACVSGLLSGPTRKRASGRP